MGKQIVVQWNIIGTMEYYLAIKCSELPSHKKTWGNLKCILLSEKS